jgi:cell division initiation protein
MITPIEIQSKTFKSGGLGYDKKDVDGFLRDVLRSYEQIYRENMELNDKVAVLSEGIQYYKTIEKTLQKALVLAEKTAEDTKNAALEKAKAIEKEANTRSQLIVADAKNELEHIHNQTIQLIQQYEKYKLQFKHLALAQMELIESESFNINVTRLDAFIDTQSEQRQTERRQTEHRQVERRQTEQRYADNRQSEHKNADRHVERHTDRHADSKHSENKHSNHKHSDHKHSDYRQSEHNQYNYSQVDLRQPVLHSDTQQSDMQKSRMQQSNMKHSDKKQYTKQEEFQVDMEPSFFDALEQVSATQEDMDHSYGNAKSYEKEDEDDYPYDQKNELENQEEFSFINLVDEED